MNDLTAFAFETITVPSAGVAAVLTRSKYDPAGQHLPVKKALISVNPGPPISYLFTGLTVGSATGHRLTAFGTVEIEGFDNIRNFQTTSMSSGTVGEISVTYFK